MVSPLILGLFASLLPSGLVLLYAEAKARKRKRQQEDILKKHKDAFDGRQWFRVRYCSQSRFRSFWKIFPWEATGILFVGDGKITCLCNSDSGEDIRLELNNENASADWLGKTRWWLNGTVSWFVLRSSAEEHYFTSETGGLVFGSKRTTEDIYERLVW